jgi:hypothetical protein
VRTGGLVGHKASPCSKADFLLNIEPRELLEMRHTPGGRMNRGFAPASPDARVAKARAVQAQ